MRWIVVPEWLASRSLLTRHIAGAFLNAMFAGQQAASGNIPKCDLSLFRPFGLLPAGGLRGAPTSASIPDSIEGAPPAVGLEQPGISPAVTGDAADGCPRQGIGACGGCHNVPRGSSSNCCAPHASIAGPMRRRWGRRTDQLERRRDKQCQPYGSRSKQMRRHGEPLFQYPVEPCTQERQSSVLFIRVDGGKACLAELSAAGCTATSRQASLEFLFDHDMPSLRFEGVALPFAWK